MLLRAIEEKALLPDGLGPRGRRATSSSSPARTATSPADVAQGDFREDLLARINLWTFRLPGARASAPRTSSRTSTTSSRWRRANRHARHDEPGGPRALPRLRDSPEAPGRELPRPQTSRGWRRSRQAADHDQGVGDEGMARLRDSSVRWRRPTRTPLGTTSSRRSPRRSARRARSLRSRAARRRLRVCARSRRSRTRGVSSSRRRARETSVNDADRLRSTSRVSISPSRGYGRASPKRIDPFAASRKRRNAGRSITFDEGSRQRSTPPRRTSVRHASRSKIFRTTGMEERHVTREHLGNVGRHEPGEDRALHFSQPTHDAGREIRQGAAKDVRDNDIEHPVGPRRRELRADIDGAPPSVLARDRDRGCVDLDTDHLTHRASRQQSEPSVGIRMFLNISPPHAAALFRHLDPRRKLGFARDPCQGRLHRVAMR